MIIQNSKIYYKGEIVEKDIQIDGNKIVAIENNFNEDRIEERINGKGLLILPGLIDPHVHLREPGAEHKEDFYTGTRAAIAGGFTTVLDMPNNPKPTITAERLKEKKELAKKKAVCDVGFHFGATKDNFEEIKKANPDSLKMYLGETTGDLLLADQNSIKRHIKEFENPIVIHTDDDDPLKTYPCRETGIQIVMSYAKMANKKNVYFAHTSYGQKLKDIKKENYYVEVAPHHLFLSEKDFGKLGNRRFVKPELKPEEKRREMWNYLDQIDCIGSDHAPHLLEEKEKGAFGFPGLETSFHLFLDSYIKGGVSLKWIVERMAENPAKIFNLQGKGKIEKGYFADLTFVDMKKEWVVKEEELETKCKWSPYNGWRLQGKVVGVMHKGKVKYWDQEFQ